MKKLFEKINAKVEKMDNKLEGLRDKKQELTVDKVEIDRNYKELLVAESTGDTVKQSDLVKLKEKSENIGKDLVVIDEQIEAIEQGRAAKIKEDVPALKEARDKEISQASKAILEIQKELKKHRAEFMLHVKEINNQVQRAREADGQFKAAARQVTAEYEKDFYHLPATNLYATNDGPDKAIGVLKQEVDRAVSTGILPLWIEHYSKTGEVLTDAEVRAKQTSEGIK